MTALEKKCLFYHFIRLKDTRPNLHKLVLLRILCKMPDVQSTLEFLANIPLYQQEKPYFVLPLAGSTIDPDKDPVTNIKLVPEELTIYDIRQQGQEFSIGTNGFQIIKHRTQALPVNNIESLKSYKTETEDMLKGLYPDAECVHTWDFRVRGSKRFVRCLEYGAERDTGALEHYVPENEFRYERSIAD
jgi:hypothetical protein